MLNYSRRQKFSKTKIKKLKRNLQYELQDKIWMERHQLQKDIKLFQKAEEKQAYILELSKRTDQLRIIRIEAEL